VSLPPNSRNADGVFEPFHIDQVPWKESSRGTRFGLRYQQLAVYGGATQIGVSNEILPPGKQANPFHYHMLEEEHVFVLEGSMTLRLGDQHHVLGPGHYVCFPAGQPVGHSLHNHTSEPCRYLIIGKSHPHEVAVFPDTGRVEVSLMKQGYKQGETLGYWEGVDTGEPG
jgi:uncharacterized cupin superfamily protein